MTTKSRSEDEWFTKYEKDLIKNLQRERLRREKEMAELLKMEEAKKQKELHWMKCPKCGSKMVEEPLKDKLVMDRCGRCGGLHFDRGELEEILLKPQKRSLGIGVLQVIFPSKSKKSDSQKALLEFQADQDRRKKLVDEWIGSEKGKAEKELHRMKCPKCGSDLQETDVSAGLLVDLCTVCQGVFLDFGEMESIRSLSEKDRQAIRMRLLTLPLSGEEGK